MEETESREPFVPVCYLEFRREMKKRDDEEKIRQLEEELNQKREQRLQLGEQLLQERELLLQQGEQLLQLGKILDFVKQGFSYDEAITKIDEEDKNLSI